MSAILDWLAANAVAAFILALAVTAACWLVRSPHVRHRLWLLVLLKLLLPPLAVIGLSWPAAPPAPLVPLVVTDVPVDAEPLPEFVPAVAAPASFTLTHGLFALALTGAVAWWALAHTRLIRFQRLLRHARPAPAQLQATAATLAAQLGLRHVPAVVLLDAPISPLVWAWFGRPRVVLPADWFAALEPAQQDAILLHELAHLQRGDHWVRRLELLVLGLYWWLPVAWWARRQLLRLEEECCDACVVWASPNGAPAYAAALLAAVEYLTCSRAALPAHASGVRCSAVKRRLTMILTQPPRRPTSWTGRLAVLAVAAVVLPWCFAVDEPMPKKVSETPPKTEANPPAAEVPARDWRRIASFDVAGLGQPAVDRDELRGEIELADAQLRIREAQLDLAKKTHDIAERQYHEASKATGAMPARDLFSLEAQVIKARGDVAIREAELREAQARRQLLIRRLQRLEPQAKPERKPDLTIDLRAKSERVIKVTLPISVGSDEDVPVTGLRASNSCLVVTNPLTVLSERSKPRFDIEIDRGLLASEKTLYLHIALGGARPSEQTAAFLVKPFSDTAEERLKVLTEQIEKLQKEAAELRKQAPPVRP